MAGPLQPIRADLWIHPIGGWNDVKDPVLLNRSEGWNLLILCSAAISSSEVQVGKDGKEMGFLQTRQPRV